MDLNKLDKDIEMYKEGIERAINEDIPRVERQIHEIESEMRIYGYGAELTEEDVKDDPIYLENKAKVEKENEKIELHKNAAKHNIEKVISLLKEKNQQLYDEFLSKKPIQNQQKLDQLKTANTKLDFEKQQKENKIQQKVNLIEKYREIGDVDRVAELHREVEELKQIKNGIEQEQRDNDLEISLLENDAQEAKYLYNQNLKVIANYRKMAKDNGIKLEEPTVEIKPEETKPEETKPEETKPEETKPEEIKPEETKPEETKPEEIKPEETKPEEIKPEETKPEEIKPEETKPEETKPEEIKPEETKPEEIKPEEIKPEETKPTEKVDLLKDVKIIIGKKGLTIKAPGLNKEDNKDEITLNLKELENETDWWRTCDYEEVEALFHTKIKDEAIDAMDPNILTAMEIILLKSDMNDDMKKEIVSRYVETMEKEGDVPSDKSLKGIMEYDKTGIQYWKLSSIISKSLHYKQFEEMQKYADLAEKRGIAEVKQDKPGWIGKLVSNMKNKVKLLGTGNEDRLENTEEYQNANRREKKLLKEAEKHRNKTKDVVATHTSITEKNGKVKTTTYELKKDGELKKENPFKKGLENLKAKAESNKPHPEKVVESDGDVLEKTTEEEVK